MPELNVLTRMGSSPDGKSKIYFCCHPEDASLCFHRVCDPILKICDCAIYYKEDHKNGSVEDFPFFLRQVNLVVLAVTERLLITENDALDRELPLIREQNIPILPIMQEPGLAELFGQRVGKLQYLNPFHTDATVIPYEVKLEKFLSAVLIGDELTAKVQQAFDAYIFLSYRKKDREQAQKLMELIHENEMYRDVAIWYDEFLNPGEDYRQQIDTAMDKSVLFLLAVTPNLLEDQNFIMRVEYPRAKQRAIPVLPVEMVETDGQALLERFFGISRPIPAEEKEQLVNALRQLLNSVALRKNNDPTHSFFMGLAYLSGIDVEKNPQRAAGLITDAAESGLEEAMEKLSEMYFHGNGVPVNFEEALSWKAKALFSFGDYVESHLNDENAMIYLQKEIGYAELAADAELYDKAAASYEKALDLAKMIAIGSISTNVVKKAADQLRKIFSNKRELQWKALFLHVQCGRRLMELYDQIGMKENAFQSGRKALSVGDVVWGQLTGTYPIETELSLIFGRMAVICAESGNLEGAEDWVNKEASCLPENINENFNDYLQGVNYLYHLSLLEKAKGNSGQALEHGRGALEGLDQLRENYPSEYIFGFYITLILHLYELLEGAGSMEEAIDLLNQAEQKIDMGDIKNQYSPVIRRGLNSFVIRRGSALIREGEPVAARSLMEKSTELLLSDLQKDLSEGAVIEAAYACERMGTTYAMEKNYPEAARWYEKGCTVLREDTAGTRTIVAVRRVSQRGEQLFDMLLLSGDLLSARKWYDITLSMMHDVAVSTRLATDEANYQSFRKKLTVLEQKEQKALCENEQETAAEASETLEAYLRRMDPTVPNRYPDLQAELDQRMAEIAREYYTQYVRMKSTDDAFKLFSLLTNLQGAADKAKDLDYQIASSCGHISEDIMQHYKPSMKYDEVPMLLNAYCGYQEIHQMHYFFKKITRERLQDFLNFYPHIVHFKYPMEKIQYPEIWVLLNHMITHGIVFKYRHKGDK